MGEIAFALVLGFGAIVAALIGSHARKTALAYVMFASALYASLAAADLLAALAHLPGEADAIALLVAALAPASLALAMAGNRINTALATFILCVALIAGLFAAMTGEAAAAFAPLFASVCAMLAMALRRRNIHAGLGALAFLAASASFLSDTQSARMALALFSAAGLIGVALASGAEVEARRKRPHAFSINAKR